MDPFGEERFHLVCGPGGNLDQDLICIRCGYNLRGLRPDGACPECATPVERSVQGDCLCFAPPEGIEGLARGMNYIVAAIILSTVAPCLVGLTLGAEWALGSLLIVGVLKTAGSWLVTMPEVVRSRDEPFLTVRSLSRALAVFNYVGVWGFFFWTMWVPVRLYYLGASILGLTAAIEFISTLIYARRLALRIPSWRLAADAGALMWGWVLMAVVWAFVILFSGPGDPSGVMFAVSICASVAFVVLPFLTLMFILGLRWKLSETTAIARAVWKRPSRDEAKTVDNGD